MPGCEACGAHRSAWDAGSQVDWLQSAEAGTRFNALRHGVLSRYTVLPWEDADEYQAIVMALVAEHAPQGPTEEHLVEEIAGILWRKRRLRLAEAAAHRRGFDGTLESHRKIVKVALVHLDVTDPSEHVIESRKAVWARALFLVPALLPPRQCQPERRRR